VYAMVVTLGEMENRPSRFEDGEEGGASLGLGRAGNGRIQGRQ